MLYDMDMMMGLMDRSFRFMVVNGGSTYQMFKESNVPQLQVGIFDQISLYD